MSKNFALLIAAAALLTPAHGATITVTNTFAAGETPPAGVDGTAPAAPIFANGVHALGITFGFTQGGSASSAAIYGHNADTLNSVLGPLSDPVLEGPANGTLTLTFDAPSTFLSFDIAFGWDEDSGGQVTVGENSKAFTTTGGSGFLGVFSLGRFSWIPDSPFTQVVITFNESVGNETFDIDNLAYDASDSIAAAPEPGSWISFGSGALLMGLLTGLRQFRASRLSR